MQWVEPTLVAEVAFSGWTPDGRIRHARYVGLRDDKRPDEITVARPAKSHGTVRVGGVAVSHADRIVDPQSGATKLDLVRYYESVAERILPHLAGRPCALLRAPRGVAGKPFFQRHATEVNLPGVDLLDAALLPDQAPLLTIGSVEALIAAAQMNVIEFHPWNALARRLDTPDRMIFDLDPGDGTPWPQVVDAARLVRRMLAELRLQCWLKTSGGRGLHIVVPIAPRHDTATIKSLSKAVVVHLADTLPTRFVARSGAANRVGRVFVDFLRNGAGATTAAAYSVRARPGLGVSVPVSWDDLARLSGGASWTLGTVRDHLSFVDGDPWEGFWTARQSLAPALRMMTPPRSASSPTPRRR